MQLFRSIATVGGWTMISRVLGFIRDVMLAQILGAGVIADAFFIAFKFPNLFRRLFGEGAMNAAFVPLYAKRLEAGGVEQARAFAADVAAVLSAWSLFLTVVALAFMPWIMMIQAAGFVDQPEKFDLTVELARITFPYLLFMVLAALLSGMLNSAGKFAAAAAAPVILNLVFIATLVLIDQNVILRPGHGLAVAVAVAGALQFLMLVYACSRAGIMVPLPRPKVTPGVRRMLVLMAPGVIGAGVVQINVMVGDLLATLLAEGSVSFLYYADRVNQLPLGVIGVAVGIALLPLLTRQLRAGEDAAARNSLNRALEFSLLMTVPAAAALVAIPGPLISVLFERGAFGAEAAEATAGALRAFAIGLPAYVLIKALLPGFFAREDTKTPVQVAAGAMILNVALASVLMQFMAHVGIALAAAISAWVNVATLSVILARRGHFDPDARLKKAVPRQLAAAVIMAGSLAAAAQVAAAWLDGPLAAKTTALGALVAGGVALYFLLAALFGAARPSEVRRLLRRSS